MDGAGGLESILGSLMSDPEMMDKLRAEAAALGLDGLLSPNDGETAARAGQPPRKNGDGGAGISPDMLARVMKLMPLISDMTREDDSVRLLNALRPFLSEERGRRIDEAGKLLSVVHIMEKLPALLSEDGGDCDGTGYA